MANRNKNTVNKASEWMEYGVEYKAGKVKAPLFGYIPKLIPVDTNGKVGDAGTWSMSHGNDTYKVEDMGDKTRSVMECAGLTSIQGSCPCHCDDCYCDNGRYRMDPIKAANMRKLILAKLYPEWTEKAITAQIKIEGIKQVRIHASGDFFSPEYVDMWRRIVIACDGTTFWTYTKYEYALNAFRDLDNITITPSVLPMKKGFNFGTCAELLDKYHALTKAGYRVHICACGTNMETHCSDCKHGCKAIGKECDYVLFIKHSTANYKAGKTDPVEYAKVCEIIARQAN